MVCNSPDDYIYFCVNTKNPKYHIIPFLRGERIVLSVENNGGLFYIRTLQPELSAGRNEINICCDVTLLPMTKSPYFKPLHNV